MNLSPQKILDFSIDVMGEDQYLAYGKLSGTGTDIISAFVTKTKDGVETVFTLSDVSIDVEKTPDGEVIAKEAARNAHEKYSKLRVQLLVGFLNNIVTNVLLDVEGKSRLVIPFCPGISNASFKDVRDGINSADEVRLDTLSNQLILICAE